MKADNEDLNQVEQDYAFYREAILNISSSLELPKALIAAFKFLRQHFPLEGLSLHTLEREKQALHLLFLVTEQSFFHVDEYVPLNEKYFTIIKDQEHKSNIRITRFSHNDPVTEQIDLSVSSFLPQKNRGYLVAMMPTEKKVAGHLCLLGSAPECFTAEHSRKIEIISPAFSLMMINLLQYRKVVQRKNKEIQEKQLLAEKIRYLSDHQVIGNKGGLKHIMKMVEQLTGRDVPVLITGETGSGKEIIADAIQHVSSRFDAPFIKVNCGAIPENLIDSELFGHEKGAFTGAITHRIGRFEQADGGTLFLDEIGDMPFHAQTRLLRVVQHGTLERVGGHKSISVNVRIIAATHRDLKREIYTGKFREDLFYRLNVFPIKIPALRERRQDIPALVHHFVKQKSQKMGLAKAPKITKDSIEALSRYDWPGNVRELENLIDRALILEPEGELQVDSLISIDQTDSIKSKEMTAIPATQPDPLTPAEKNKQLTSEPPIPMTEEIKKGKKTLDEIMATHIRATLQQCSGKISGPGGAAEILDIKPNTLRKRMDKLKILYGHKKWNEFKN